MCVRLRIVQLIKNLSKTINCKIDDARSMYEPILNTPNK